MEEQYPLWLYLSTFSSIYWPKTETKTCRFGTIPDSATRSTSCRRFFDIHFCCRESPTLFPFKPLILTLHAKIVNNCLPLGFNWHFFCVRVPDITGNPKKKKTVSRNRISIKFYIRKWAVKNSRTNTMVTLCQKNRATCVYVIFRSIQKSAPVAVQYCRLRVDYMSQTKLPPSCIIIFF